MQNIRVIIVSINPLVVALDSVASVMVVVRLALIILVVRIRIPLMAVAIIVMALLWVSRHIEI